MSLSFRDEFPFLDKPGCLVELEALASRKFTKYRAYVRLHQKLRDCTDLQQCTEVAGELVDNYIDNRLIWQELNWYKEHGGILGKHPAFAEFRRRKELVRMPVKELMTRLRQVEMNIWRVKSELAKGDKPHLDAIRHERLAGYEKERADILRLLE